MEGENAVFGSHLSQSSLGLNSQVAIDPRQSMLSGFHFRSEQFLVKPETHVSV